MCDMTIASHPTTEAVEALARALSPRPDHASEYVKTASRALTAAYPQIVADVLNHCADQMVATGDITTYEDEMWLAWLRRQAEDVEL